MSDRGEAAEPMMGRRPIEASAETSEGSVGSMRRVAGDGVNDEMVVT